MSDFFYKPEYIIESDNNSETSIKTISSNVYLIFSGIFLIFLLGNRGLTGTDTPVYYGSFSQFLNSSYFEPFYKFIQDYFFFKGYSFLDLELVMAIFAVAPIIMLFFKFGRNTTLLLLAYYGPFQYFINFNIMRQGVAVTLYACSIFLLLNQEKNNKIFLKVILSALLMYSAYNFHHSIAIGVIIFILSLVIELFSVKKLAVIVKILIVLSVIGIRFPITAFSNFLNIFGITYLQSYANTGYLQYNSNLYNFANIIMCFTIFCLINLKQLNTWFEKYVYVQMMIYLIVSAYFGNPQFVVRILYYTQIFFPFLFAIVWKRGQKLYVRDIFLKLMIIVYIIFNFYISIQSGANGINPYLGKLF